MASSNTLAIEIMMATRGSGYSFFRPFYTFLLALGLSSSAIPVWAASDLTFLPSSPFSFADIQVSLTSASEYVELVNYGSSTLTINELTKSPTTGCSQFIMQFQQTPVSLENGEVATMEIAFAPTLRGSQSCDITVESNDPNGTAIYTLDGTGVGSELAIEPGRMIFDDTHVGDSSDPQYFTVSNVGDAGFPLTILSVNIQASDNDEDYVIDGFLSGIISNGASELVQATFLPQSAGDQNATIGISSDASVNAYAEKELVGRGIERLIALVPQTLLFPRVLPGQSESAPITIENVGEATLTVSDLAVSGVNKEKFSISQPDVLPTPESPVEIPGGGEFQILINCAPVTSGNYSSQLVVSSNADNEPEATAGLQCVAQEAPEIIFWNGFELR